MASSNRVTSESGLERARAMLAAGDIDGAQSACAVLTATSDAREAARAYLILSACAERLADPASARAHVEAALQRNPEDPLVHYALAEIQERAGENATAIASLERAVALQDAFAAAHHRLG